MKTPTMKTLKHVLFLMIGGVTGEINMLLINAQTFEKTVLAAILSVLIFVLTVSLLIVIFDKKK